MTLSPRRQPTERTFIKGGALFLIFLMPLILLSGVGQELLHRCVPEAIEGFGSTVTKDAHEGYELGGRQVRQLTFLKYARHEHCLTGVSPE